MKEKKQQTWGGRFSQSPSDLMLNFGESVSFDSRLAPFDIFASKAQANMLAKIKILTKKEAKDICNGLDKIEEQIRSGKFSWDITLEDVHMNVESALTKIVPAAKKLHTARSRNDQVATDMRLFFKYASVEILMSLKALISELLVLAKQNVDIIIPGYTHLQRAQPVSVAHHILAWVEMFLRDKSKFEEFFARANISPLGSGAIAGTTIPIDRVFSASQMGFVNDEDEPVLTQNSMDAVADRDLFLDFASICGNIAIHLSRICEDVILWNTSEFSYIKLPDTFTTGSSLMPQKKNPDSLELIRGKSARIIGNISSIYTMLKGLPMTYNRDLQEDKICIFSSFDETLKCLEVLKETLKASSFNKEKCLEAAKDPMLLATDLADYLVMKKIPFRQAHHIVGELVALSEKENIPLNEIPDEKAKKICPELKSDWKSVFDLERAMRLRTQVGMPSKENILNQIKRVSKILA